MEKVFIISELGINHNGDFNLVKRMINESVDSGADAVKFQKRDINLVYSEEFLKEKRQSPWGFTQREQKEGLELSEDEYKEIDIYKLEINFNKKNILNSITNYRLIPFYKYHLHSYVSQIRLKSCYYHLLLQHYWDSK